MLHRLGPFELDEAARSLMLQGKPVALQPKVFDLLVHLVNNAGRVVPKSELLDLLWPDVHVTEASLQRAVSLLRRALKEGGMDGALKSFVRHGYRFAVDKPELAEFLPMAPLIDGCEAARQAAIGRDWTNAAALFEAHEATGTLTAEDYETWAFAAECMGRPAQAVQPLSKAVELRMRNGAISEACWSAVTLAKIHLERGEMALTRGWLAHARSLMEETQACETLAYYYWMQSRALVFEGRTDEALEIGRLGNKTAQACGSIRMQALTLAYMGFYNITLGRLREGVEQQDHAAAMGLATRLDPITGAIIYCNILWACRSAADWSRANQWTIGFETWCQSNFAKVSPSCQLHRAEVDGVTGALPRALASVNAALEGLSRTDPWAMGDAYRVRGDIHAAIGDVSAARADYARAYETGWDAEPGNALLLYEAGDTAGALAALDRILSGQGWFSLQRRAWILANKARLCALAGRRDEARTCLDALLRQDGEGWPSPAVHALTVEAEADLAVAPTVEPSRVQHLILARQLWTSLGADYHTARVRLLLAEHLTAAGDLAGAQAEARGALAAASQAGAAGLVARAQALIAPRMIEA